jgi:golgi SNAP receptor complex member 2
VRRGVERQARHYPPLIMSNNDLINAQKLIQQASSMTERLERGILGDPTTLESMLQHARATAQELLGSRRAQLSVFEAKRAELLLAECDSLQRTVDKTKKRAARDLELKSQREKLLGGAGSSGYFNRADDTDASLLARESQGLAHSRKKVQQMVDEGHAVMSALKGQGTRMSSSNQKTAELLEALGVSNHTILAIVRTNRVDAWIVYIGIALTLMLMWYLWVR